MRKTPPSIATCIIYARYSTDQQNPLSCADQIAECREYAERRGWRVIAVEADEAVRAGADIGMRAGLQRAIARIKEGGVDALFVHEVSRVSRDFYDAFGILSELRRELRYVVGLDHGVLDLQDTEGTRRLVEGVIRAEEETQRISFRTRRGLKARAKRRSNPGGRPAYGYRRAVALSPNEVDINGRPVVIDVRVERDEAAAAVVERIFRLYDAASRRTGSRRCSIAMACVRREPAWSGTEGSSTARGRRRRWRGSSGTARTQAR